MKKLILTAFLIGASLLSVNARTKIVRSGSSDGIHYDRVVETHGIFNTTLSCTRPGATKCSWVNMPNRIKGNNGSTYAVSEIEAWIESQIASGSTSGNAIYLGNTGIVVDWSSNGFDREIIINDAN